MKKILLASTALVATTGFAMADMTWSGSANMGVKYSDNGTTQVHNEIDLGMAATGETEGGIAWKVEMGLDSNTSDAVQAGAADVGSVSLTGDFGTIRVGAAATAGTTVGIGDIGFDGSAVDAAAHKGRHTGSTTPDVQWNYSMDDIAIHASTETSTDDTALALSWTSGELAIAVSHSAAGASAATANAISIGTSVGQFAVEVTAASHSTAANDSLGLSASMADVAGLGTVTFITGSNDTDAKSSYGIGFSKSLGADSGATLKGYVGSVNGNDVADLGIGFSF